MLRKSWISVTCLGALLASCAGGSPVKLVGGKQSLEGLVPWHQQTLTVAEVTQQEAFLLADLVGGSMSVHAYFAADEGACAAVLKKGDQVTFQGTERFGEVVGPAGTCRSLGTRELVAFRDRQLSAPSMMEGRMATFRTVHRDGEIWVRGIFPYASNLGFLPDDLIMVVPKSAACVAATSSGTAMMYFYNAGSRVFMLEANASRCSVVGVIEPAGAD